VSNDEARLEGVRINRRTLLRGGAVLLAGAFAGQPLLTGGRPASAAGIKSMSPHALIPPGPGEQLLHLAGTDGWVSMPGTKAIPPFWPDPLAPNGFNTYAFGFRDVTGLTDSQVLMQRGLAQISAPILAFDEYDPVAKDNAVRVTLSNLGLAVRPDLVDGHTIHWHGFVNAIPLFDGVPELSISVPIGRSFTYYYRPRDAGTFMYHCHFEDVEHVQMGMTGVLYVRPLQNKHPVNGDPAGTKYAYNDGDGSTRYDREFAYMLTELWVEGHYRDAHIQTTDWTDFQPSYWLMNGRAYPDTLQPSTNPLVDHAMSGDGMPGAGWDGLSTVGHPTSDNGASLRYNPITSLITANSGERVLLRISNLGYQHHAMTLDGIPMKVVAKDASLLRNGATDLSYETNTVEVGPGESRDVIFVAPEVTAPTTFRLYDRNYAYLSNGGGAGYGGQITEVRVSPAGTLPAQTQSNA
jgi:FtsP/CotA-like multicopper oxidase with cupredoxin domain